MSVQESVVRVARWADRFLPEQVGVTILLYHRVGGGSASSVDLPVERFREQMEHLAAHHRVVDLDTAAGLLTGDAPDDTSGDRRGDHRGDHVDDHGARDPSVVVLTFDDGTSDFAEHVMPVLASTGLPATLYVSTAFVDTGDPFPWGAPPLSWTALREVAATGLVTVGSHAHTHALFDRCTADVAVDELDRSIELIERHLGTPPRHFAYPKALPGNDVNAAAVRQRFATAALARNRVNRPGHTDPHRLWRTPVQRADQLDVFTAKASGRVRLEGELRHLAGPVRTRGLSN